MNKGLLAKLSLFIATIIWGTTFFIMEGTIENIGIFYLLAFRFTGAGLLLALILFNKLKKINIGYIIRGAVLGIFIIAAYILQTYGLADVATTPGKNAFLTATYCVIVPFLAWALKGPKPDFYNIVAAVMCLFGITLISVTGNDFSSVCKGDILTLLGGILFSFHMVAIAIFSQKHDVLLLTLIQFLVSGLVAWCFAIPMETFPIGLPAISTAAIAYLTIFATCGCYIFQNWGQKYTHPAAASLILSLEAVFGVLFSVIFASEKPTAQVITGFAIVFASVLISETKPFSKLIKKGEDT